MSKLQRSWCIFRKSMVLIGSERKLLIFPLISFCAMLVLIALIIAGSAEVVISAPETGQCTASAAASTTEVVISAPETGQCTASTAEAEDAPMNAMQIVIFFVLYLFTMLVSNFCLTAFFCEIINGLKGEAVSVKRGFTFAAGRFKSILLWSLLASTVGILLAVIGERLGFIGKIIIKLIGATWSVASCFAIPALVCDSELQNPFEALRRSVTAIKRTWGESLIGFAGIHIISVMALLLWLILSIGTTVLCFFVNGGALVWSIGVIFMSLLLVALIVFCYLVGVAQHIYQAALYLYANGTLTGDFSPDELNGAFKK